MTGPFATAESRAGSDRPIVSNPASWLNLERFWPSIKAFLGAEETLETISESSDDMPGVLVSCKGSTFELTRIGFDGSSEVCE